MKSKLNNLQSDWLNQAEELNDNEAAQVNGGMQMSPGGASDAMGGAAPSSSSGGMASALSAQLDDIGMGVASLLSQSAGGTQNSSS